MKTFYLKKIFFLILFIVLIRKISAQETPNAGIMTFETANEEVLGTNIGSELTVESSSNTLLNGFDLILNSSNANSTNSISFDSFSNNKILSFTAIDFSNGGNGVLQSCTLKTDSGDEIFIKELLISYFGGSNSITFKGYKNSIEVASLTSDFQSNTDILINLTNPDSGAFNEIDELRITPENVVVQIDLDNIVIDVATLSNEEFYIKDQFSVYPNPTKDELIINNSFKKMKIYNLEGQLIISTTKNIISLANYTDGLYLAHITSNNNKNTVVKILKN